MSALIHVLKQTERIVAPRLPGIMALLVIIAIAGAVLLVRAAPNAVLYNGERIPMISPIETSVCLGGTVHFATVTEVTADEIPGALDIKEAWCLAGLGGACKSVLPPNPDLPMLEEKHIVTPSVERNVPVTLAPGVYHFQHSATDAKGNTTGYIVAPINVEACEVQP